MPLHPKELKLLREVVSLPTAPFCEKHVQDYIKAWAESVGIQFQQDRVGNILLCYPGKGEPPGSPWVLQSHMDHPGFTFIRRRGKLAQAWFRGGVKKDYFPGSNMRFFYDDECFVRGTVLSVRRDSETGFLRCRIELEQAVELPEGALGMWDIVPWRRRGDTLSLRVADDLCGVAAVLLTLERVKSAGGKRRVYGLLTRAEEVGFIGALSAAQNETVDPSWPVLGIEMSKAQLNARLGDGAVIRVGDALSIFDPGLTAILRQAARDLGKQKKTASPNYVATLMPGGSTESTGLAQMGYRTCAVCLPLGNYHNMGESKIAPEKINLHDFEALLSLLTDVSRRDPDLLEDQALKTRLLENHRKRSPLL